MEATKINGHHALVGLRNSRRKEISLSKNCKIYLSSSWILVLEHSSMSLVLRFSNCTKNTPFEVGESGTLIHHSHHPTPFSAFCHSPAAFSAWTDPVESSIAIDQGESACFDLALFLPDSLLLMMNGTGVPWRGKNRLAVVGTAAGNGQAPMRRLIPSARDVF